MAVPWTVQLCRDGQTIAVPSAYTLGAKALRNTAGEWSLSSSPAGIPPSGYPDPFGVEEDDVPFDPRDVESIRLIGEGRVIYAGAVAGENGGFWVESDENGVRWRWTGIELGWHIAESRIAYPDPTMSSGWAVSHDERTGVASTVLAEYFDVNIGAGALAARQHPDVQVDDQQVGSSMEFSARLQPLSELAAKLAADGEFEVIPQYDADGGVTFLLSKGRDLSSVLTFSDQADLARSEARFVPRSATYVLSGGQGEGSSRTFRSADSGAAGADRFEVFSDVSSLSTAAQVQADANARLGLSADMFSITTTLTGSAASLALRAGIRLGDRVAVVMMGRRYSVPVESVDFEVSPGRQVMRPQFGVAEPNEFVALKRRLSALEHVQRSSIA